MSNLYWNETIVCETQHEWNTIQQLKHSKFNDHSKLKRNVSESFWNVSYANMCPLALPQRLPFESNMADEEEEDYMSESFLLGLGDSRPGLLSDRIAKEYEKEAKRKHKQEKNKVKPLKERENEHREVALASAIDSSNKGFALLQKMGYKEGMGLGKSGKQCCYELW